jgi:MFS family permease
MSRSEQNFRLVFWAALLPGIFAVGLLAVGVQEPRNRVSHKKTNPLRWKALLSLGKGYWSLVAVALLFNLGNSSEAFLLLQAEKTGITSSLVPLTLVVMNMTYSFSAYPVGWLSDQIGRLGLLVGGFSLYALVYMGFAFADAPWQVWGLFAFYGLHLGMSQGILLALVADQVPSELRGTAFGLINLATGVALLPASLLAGVLWQEIGSHATFIAGSLFAITAVALLLATSRRQQ